MFITTGGYGVRVDDCGMQVGVVVVAASSAASIGVAAAGHGAVEDIA